MDAPIYFRKAMLEVGDLRVWHAVRRCVAGEQPQVHGHVREGAAALGAEGIRVLLCGVVQYHGAGGKHGPHDRGREELQAEFRTGRFGGYAGSADFFELLQEIPLHKMTVSNYNSIFVAITHRGNHSTQAADLPVPCPDTWIQKSGNR